jgi:hypothetical protein
VFLEIKPGSPPHYLQNWRQKLLSRRIRLRELVRERVTTAQRIVLQRFSSSRVCGFGVCTAQQIRWILASNSRYPKRLQIARARDIVKVKQNVHDVLLSLNARLIDFDRLNCRGWVGKRSDLEVNIDHHAYH